MNFYPQPTRSGFILLAIAFVAGAATAWLVGILLQQNNPAKMFQWLMALFIMLIVTGLAVYWAIIAFKLHYHLNRNGLAIEWGVGQQRIPFENIQQIVPAKSLAANAAYRGINLAGLRFGSGNLTDYGVLKFRTTAPLENSLLVVTTDQSYVISPYQPDTFLRAWQVRQPLGPTQHWTEDVRPHWPLNIAVLNDQLMWALLGASAFLLLTLLGSIALNYADYPGAFPIHFDNLGRADRIAPKIALFILPAVGGIVWLVNAALGTLVHRWERVAAYLLWGSTAVMQFCLWIALLTITA